MQCRARADFKDATKSPRLKVVSQMILSTLAAKVDLEASDKEYTLLKLCVVVSLIIVRDYTTL